MWSKLTIPGVGEENAITQNISIDIQTNSLPELVDSGGLPTDGIQPAPDLIRVGGRRVSGFDSEDSEWNFI